MRALSLLPPALKGLVRGCGSVDRELVLDDAIDEGGGERTKPPGYCSEVVIAVMVRSGFLKCTWRDELLKKLKGRR